MPKFERPVLLDELNTSLEGFFSTVKSQVQIDRIQGVLYALALIALFFSTFWVFIPIFFALWLLNAEQDRLLDKLVEGGLALMYPLIFVLVPAVA